MFGANQPKNKGSEMNTNYSNFLTSPLINIEIPFLENLTQGPFFNGNIPHPIYKPKHLQKKFLEYIINSPLGIPACPATANAKGIQLLSSLGFDVFTCKTIRSTPAPVHPFPNIVFINAPKNIDPTDTNTPLLYQTTQHTNMSELAIANSIGNPSFILEDTLEEMNNARQLLKKNQILIASIFGTETKKRNMIDDFIYLAQQTKDAGFHAIEANFSCPNVHTGGTIYTDPKLVATLTKKMVHVLKDIPLILKIGYIQNLELFKTILITAARAGAQGICGINTISRPIINKKNKTVFPGRDKAGISGAPIRNAALSFIRNATAINAKEKLDLTLLATGGITLPEHFDIFFNAGADIAMSATGTMWDPYLALRYYDYANTKQSFTPKTKQGQTTR
jgi:dihydroorotate dehydrogenase